MSLMSGLSSRTSLAALSSFLLCLGLLHLGRRSSLPLPASVVPPVAALGPPVGPPAALGPPGPADQAWPPAPAPPAPLEGAGLVGRALEGARQGPAVEGAGLGPARSIEDYLGSRSAQQVRDWEPPIACPKRLHKRPVQSFLFYALHKTGSTKIRTLLNHYCDKHKLQCFAPEMNYRFCSKAGPKCRKGIQPWVDLGSATLARIEKCCPDHVGTKFDAVFGHALMSDPPTAQWVYSAFKKSPPFSMVFIRDAADVFESYFHNLPYYQDMYGLPLRELVDRLLEAREFGTELSEKDQKWRHLLENSQSKEMGWDGATEESFRKVLSLVASLDFVGVTEAMGPGLGGLFLRLGWPLALLDKVGKLNMTVYDHPPALRYRILLLQDKDRRLHEFARKVYQQCHAFTLPSAGNF